MDHVLILVKLGISLFLLFSAVHCKELAVPCIVPKDKNLTKEVCEEYSGCGWTSMDYADYPKMKCQWDISRYYMGQVLDPSDSQMVTFLTPPTDKPQIYNKEISLFVPVKLEVHCISDSILEIKYSTGAPTEIPYEVPQDALRTDHLGKANCSETDYTVTIEEQDNPGVKIVRKSSGITVFDTRTVGLALSQQFQQITVALNSSKVYGFGEHNHRQFQHDMNYKTWSIFTRDVGVVDDWNLYGAHPYFMNLDSKNEAIGVFLKNTNAMDIFLQPNAVTYRVIGGVLDFYVFMGPTPESLVEQYTSVIGRPMMPPYWSLGFQLSRWDYGNLSTVKTVVNRNLEANIPLDVVYGDIDYMYKKLDFTYDPENFNGLPEYVDELHNKGLKYIIILDPGIHDVGDSTIAISGEQYQPLVHGLEHDIFVKSYDGTNLQGKVWPGTVYFPDFTNPNTTIWWRREIDQFHTNRSTNISGVPFDGLWIDMNEAANFVEGEEAKAACPYNPQWNEPLFVPENLLGGYLPDKTYCMDAMQHWGRAYDVHSLYGHSMAQATFKSLATLQPTKRPFVISRSTFAGSGQYAAHWLGDNQSGWEHLSWSIVGMMEFSLFGFSMTGADICGFWFATTEEMCQRWMQLGAFYPFSRNHNGRGFPAQDPAAFGEDMIESSRKALNMRYQLLPYLYTLMHLAHTEGQTVVRPLLHEFVQDSKTHAIDKQFLWGKCILVSPVMEKNKTDVEAYFPPAARWYGLEDGIEVDALGWNTISAALDVINIHIRGGCIIPRKLDSVSNTKESLEKPFSLLVTVDDKGAASGSFYTDDGESSDGDAHLKAELKLLNNFLEYRIVHNSYFVKSLSQKFESIIIYGVNPEPHQAVVIFSVDPIEREVALHYNSTTKVLTLTDGPGGFPVDRPMVLAWKDQIQPAATTQPSATVSTKAVTEEPPTATTDGASSHRLAAGLISLVMLTYLL